MYNICPPSTQFAAYNKIKAPKQLAIYPDFSHEWLPGTPEQLIINELNVSIYAFDSKLLFEALKGLKNNNSQKEYYLTDVPKLMLQMGIKVDSHTINNTDEIYGVNTLEELVLCEKILISRAN